MLGVGYYCDKYLKMGKKLWNWVMHRGWKSFQVHAKKKSLHCLEQTVKSDSDESLEKKGKGKL